MIPTTALLQLRNIVLAISVGISNASSGKLNLRQGTLYVRDQRSQSMRDVRLFQLPFGSASFRARAPADLLYVLRVTQLSSRFADRLTACLPSLVAFCFTMVLSTFTHCLNTTSDVYRYAYSFYLEPYKNNGYGSASCCILSISAFSEVGVVAEVLLKTEDGKTLQWKTVGWESMSEQWGMQLDNHVGKLMKGVADTMHNTKRADVTLLAAWSVYDTCLSSEDTSNLIERSELHFSRPVDLSHMQWMTPKP